MSEFVYNDIFGSEKAKEKYSNKDEYRYYQAVLVMHNKFYENDNIHSRIFSRSRVVKPHKEKRLSLSLYNVKKLNQTTFKFTKRVPNQELPPILIKNQTDEKHPKAENLPQQSITKDVRRLRKIINNQNATIHY